MRGPDEPLSSPFGATRALALLFLATLLTLSARSPLRAQEDGVRLGVAIGSTSLIAGVVEFVHGRQSLELSVGTWSFRDLNVSAVGKAYFGASHMRPMVGGGLWAILAQPSEAPRQGVALMARFPVGFDWQATGSQYLGMELSVTRGLYVRRPDPDNLAPINPRPVPLPGMSWRWRP